MTYKKERCLPKENDIKPNKKHAQPFPLVFPETNHLVIGLSKHNIIEYFCKKKKTSKGKKQPKFHFECQDALINII